MVSIIESGTVDLLKLALDASAMRQQATARNIANAGTPGYQRLGVSFESRLGELREALQQGRRPAMTAAARPQFETLGLPGDMVALDQEMAALSENTLHHQALLKALSRHMSVLGIAVEGRR
ncbi:flagellar basal body protein [Massilia sp. BJB1822]|uniref:flagellar basal body rod protein FlgB n=1 Tax=Massilia sp. BJB1822 TaxID=2744470 RepID=UPI0015946E52|nr:flagellar basal body protein [Massilia sp. BJB1822]NVE01297.1 flagellar basal body protein [Massilia sp. BJB1822]